MTLGSDLVELSDYMEEATLTSPRVKLECPRCRHQWMQGIPLWDRGHLLMTRRSTTVAVHDSLLHHLNEETGSVVAPLLKALGFFYFSAEACSKCGHNNAKAVRGLLSPDHGSVEIRCFFLDATDLVKGDANWELRPEVVQQLLR